MYTGVSSQTCSDFAGDSLTSEQSQDESEWEPSEASLARHSPIIALDVMGVD